MTDGLLLTPHQLLQRCQLLWEVAQASPVELQPSQAAHTLDMLGEVAALCVQTRAGGCQRRRKARCLAMITAFIGGAFFFF